MRHLFRTEPMVAQVLAASALFVVLVVSVYVFAAGAASDDGPVRACYDERGIAVLQQADCPVPGGKARPLTARSR